MLNVRDNEGFTNYSAVKGWDYKQKWRTNTTDLPRKFSSSCANFFRSVRGLSREKIGIYEYSNFFFSWCYCKFRTNSSSTLPNLTPEAWQTVGFYCGYSRSSQYTLLGEPAQTMIYADSVTPMTEIVNMWHFELYLSSKGKFLSWPWKWLIVPLISDPWDYFTCFNGISSCSSFATQQSIIDKKNKRSISRRC